MRVCSYLGRNLYTDALLDADASNSSQSPDVHEHSQLLEKLSLQTHSGMYHKTLQGVM